MIDPDGAYSKGGAWWRNIWNGGLGIYENEDGVWGYDTYWRDENGDIGGINAHFGRDDTGTELRNILKQFERSSSPTPLDIANNFAVGVFNPYVDLGTTLWTSLANGYSQAYYGSEFHPDYDKWYPYYLGNDWRFHKNLSDPTIAERKKEIILGTVNANLTYISAGIAIPFPTNKLVNNSANFILKTPAKAGIIKATEAALDHTH